MEDTKCEGSTPWTFVTLGPVAAGGVIAFDIGGGCIIIEVGGIISCEEDIPCPCIIIEYVVGGGAVLDISIEYCDMLGACELA